MTAPRHLPSTAGTPQPLEQVTTPRQATPEPADRVLPLLRGALPLALGAGALTIAGCALVGGTPAALGAVLGVAVVVVFSGTGLLVLRLVRTAEPTLLMVVGLGSYLFRVVLFGVAIAVAGAVPGIDESVNRAATVLAVLLTLTAWLVGEIRAFTRLRIPIFDVPLPTASGSSAPADSAVGGAGPEDAR